MGDTVARDPLMPIPKLGEPLDTDTVPDMVLLDMEVTVLELPAMEVTDLDTVSGRDPLMPIPKLGEPLDTDTVPDMVLEDMEVTVLVLPAMEDTDTVPVTVLVDMGVTVLDTDTVDMLTESNF